MAFFLVAGFALIAIARGAENDQGLPMQTQWGSI